MSSVMDELWLIFTYYALNGNPLNPESIRPVQFVKFARDCQMLTTWSASDIHVAISGQAYSKRATKPGTKHDGNPSLIGFRDFVNLIQRISTSVYQLSSPEKCFERVLLENVLPLAGRRVPVDISMCQTPEVAQVFHMFHDALFNIFSYYAEIATRRRLSALAEQTRLRKSRSRPMGQVLTTSKRDTDKILRTRDSFSLKEYVTFCQNFELEVSLLSQTGIGDAFLNTLPPFNENITTHSMSFDMFQEVLLRLALTAYIRSEATADNKLRAFFTQMYKATNRRENGVKAAWSRPSDNSRVKQRAGSLNVYGTGIFNERLLDMWSADDFKDYAFEVEEIVEEGAAVLNRIVLNDLQHFSIKKKQELVTLEQLHTPETAVLHSDSLRQLLLQRPDVADLLHLELAEANVEDWEY